MISIQTTDVFDGWFAGLKDRQAARRVQVRIDRAEVGNFGDCAPVGEGVSEMRPRSVRGDPSTSLRTKGLAEP